jgi:hypothetical protein
MPIGSGYWGTGHEAPNLGRSPFQNDDLLQHSGSIKCSLVKIAQFGRQQAGEAGRLSVFVHDNPQK